jgi:hypothetical protein
MRERRPATGPLVSRSASSSVVHVFAVHRALTEYIGTPFCVYLAMSGLIPPRPPETPGAPRLPGNPEAPRPPRAPERPLTGGIGFSVAATTSAANSAGFFVATIESDFTVPVPRVNFIAPSSATVMLPGAESSKKPESG